MKNCWMLCWCSPRVQERACWVFGDLIMRIQGRTSKFWRTAFVGGRKDVDGGNRRAGAAIGGARSMVDGIGGGRVVVADELKLSRRRRVKSTDYLGRFSKMLLPLLLVAAVVSSFWSRSLIFWNFFIGAMIFFFFFFFLACVRR